MKIPRLLHRLPMFFAAVSAAGLIATTPLAAQAQVGSMIDLGTLGGSNSSAYGINASGQVVGLSVTTMVDPRYGRPETHAFLWTPGIANGTSGTMIDLGALGGSNSYAYDINAAGQAVGEANETATDPRLPEPSLAFLWTPSTMNGTAGTMISLGTLGGSSSGADGINASGQVVGASWTATTGQQHAFLWTPGATDGVTGNSQMKDLGSLGGSNSAAAKVNASGQVVGWSTLSGNPFDANGVAVYHAFLWTPGATNGTSGTMKDLGTLGGSTSYAVGINSAGQVVGYSTLPGDPYDTIGNEVYHAFLWTPNTSNGTTGTMIDLGVLGGNNSGLDSFAEAITDAGVVTGGATLTGDSVSHAVVWTPTVANGTTGTLTDAGTLGGTYGYADGINADGQIVGYGSPTGDPLDSYGFPITHAFVSAPTITNHAPTASSQSITATKNTAVSISLIGTDPDNDPLTYTVVSMPAHGTLSGSGANRTYTPAKNFTGSDGFTFKVNDGKADSNVATVSITVSAGKAGSGGTGNLAPVANSDSATLAAGAASVTINVLANDSDPNGDALTIMSTTNGTYGTTGIVGNQVQYTASVPRAKRGTKDTFRYTISDGKGGTATATVTVTYK